MIEKQTELFDDSEQVAASDAAQILTENNLSLSQCLYVSDTEISDQIDARNVLVKKQENVPETLYDGDSSQPLENPIHESFVAEYVACGVAAVAYRKCVSLNMSKKSSKEAASRLLRRPKIQARLTWLLLKRKTGAEGEVEHEMRDRRRDGKQMSTADLIRILEESIENPKTNASDRVRVR